MRRRNVPAHPPATNDRQQQHQQQQQQQQQQQRMDFQVSQSSFRNVKSSFYSPIITLLIGNQTSWFFFSGFHYERSGGKKKMTNFEKRSRF